LTKEQLYTLENAFQMARDWSIKDMKQMANKLGLKRTKVYKWHWDRTKKAMADAEASLKVD